MPHLVIRMTTLNGCLPVTFRRLPVHRFHDTESGKALVFIDSERGGLSNDFYAEYTNTEYSGLA